MGRLFMRGSVMSTYGGSSLHEGGSVMSTYGGSSLHEGVCNEYLWWVISS